MSVYNPFPALTAIVIMILCARFALTRAYPKGIDGFTFWVIMFLPGMAAGLLVFWMFFWDVPQAIAWLLTIVVGALMAIPVAASLTKGEKQKSHH